MEQKCCDFLSDAYLESAAAAVIEYLSLKKETDITQLAFNKWDQVGSIPPLTNHTVIKCLSHEKRTELSAIDNKKTTLNRTFEKLAREVLVIRSQPLSWRIMV